MDEEAVEPQEVMDNVMEESQAPLDNPVEQENIETDTQEKPMIPLSVAQKLREKKRELELELQWERQERQRLMQQNQPQKEKEDDSDVYESATKKDLTNIQKETLRIVEENQWIKNNPEKFEYVNEFLPQFLKQRPNLSSAISQATNRYEEAYQLMDALTPKQQQSLAKASNQAKKSTVQAPNAPTSVPKAAALNEAVDVMNMTDAEYMAWRNSKRRRR